MAHVDQLMNYFGNCGAKLNGKPRVGSEIETFFVCDDGSAITLAQSQAILKRLVRGRGWVVAGRKGDMITEVRHGTSRVLYELGYPNIELCVAPHDITDIVERSRSLLEDLYRSAEECDAYPSFAPMFIGNGDCLALPDDRDATWLQLDGEKALSPLARISAVQYTLDVEHDDAVRKLNALNAARGQFLRSYPQDSVWRAYIKDSDACYKEDRYGGPTEFRSLLHYCEELAMHQVVCGPQLVPFDKAELGTNESIALFIRSVWWYFRLRRYGQKLCIEVRPLPRRRDEKLQEQLDFVIGLMD
jgi:hypothetical protein